MLITVDFKQHISLIIRLVFFGGRDDRQDLMPGNNGVQIGLDAPPRFDPDLPAAVDEAKGLRSAYDRALAANGRSSVGRAVGPDAIPDAVGAFVRIAEGPPWTEAGLPSLPMAGSGYSG